MNERLKSAISTAAVSGTPTQTHTPEETSKEPASNDADKVATTLEELEGFHIVKAIVRCVLDAKRIVMRDTQSYCGVLVDDNNRKPICRLHFNRSQKYLGLFDEAKNEIRHPVSCLDDIYQFSEQLKTAAAYYA